MFVRSLSVLSMSIALGMWSLAYAAPQGHDQNQHAQHAGKHHKAADEAKDKAPALCPVSGEPVDKKVFTESDAGRVYFCCKGCIGKYKADPDKYAAKVFQQQGIIGPPRVQVACPVDGKPVDKEISVEHGDHAVQFCSEPCRERFTKAPDQYMKNFYHAFTTQTRCPVMDDPINPAMYVDLAPHQRVYVCCKKCVGKFQKNPAKYGANLDSFYICPMKQDKDIGALKASDCPKCGMHRKQIGKAAAAGDSKHAPKHDEAPHESESPHPAHHGGA